MMAILQLGIFGWYRTQVTCQVFSIPFEERQFDLAGFPWVNFRVQHSLCQTQTWLPGSSIYLSLQPAMAWIKLFPQTHDLSHMWDVAKKGSKGCFLRGLMGGWCMFTSATLGLRLDCFHFREEDPREREEICLKEGASYFPTKKDWEVGLHPPTWQHLWPCFSTSRNHSLGHLSFNLMLSPP